MEMYKGPERAKEEKLDEDILKAEDNEMEDEYEDDVEPEKERRDCEQEVVEFTDLLAGFETKHSLEELNAILDLTPAESRQHPVREPARLDLIPIVARLNALKEETNIEEDRYKGLQAQYRRLSNAVGMINNKVYHQRYEV